jgi:hypothetical protein
VLRCEHLNYCKWAVFAPVLPRQRARPALTPHPTLSPRGERELPSTVLVDVVGSRVLDTLSAHGERAGRGQGEG